LTKDAKVEVRKASDQTLKEVKWPAPEKKGKGKKIK